MTKVIINIDWMDHNFGAAPQDERIACVVTGKSLKDVEESIIEAIFFHIEGMISNGECVPAEFLEEWEPEFVLTTRAQLKYSDNYITRKALSRETGINEQQLSHYVTGLKKPRPGTQRKIADGIRSISRQLAFIFP